MKERRFLRASNFHEIAVRRLENLGPEKKKQLLDLAGKALSPAVTQSELLEMARRANDKSLKKKLNAIRVSDFNDLSRFIKATGELVTPDIMECLLRKCSISGKLAFAYPFPRHHKLF